MRSLWHSNKKVYTTKLFEIIFAFIIRNSIRGLSQLDNWQYKKNLRVRVLGLKCILHDEFVWTLFKQCDQMARIFASYFARYNNVSLLLFSRKIFFKLSRFRMGRRWARWPWSGLRQARAATAAGSSTSSSLRLPATRSAVSWLLPIFIFYIYFL